MWLKGLEEPTETIAERLGYKDVPLQTKLYKLLVYGEGGHFDKHKDTEKENGMIATLAIQPPSLHEGGDLLVYRNTETVYRHDFGKKGGTTAYLPHFAVHYADAEHSLEQVTKGFRLALVYSICLPPTKIHIPRTMDTTLCKEMTSAITNMQKDEDDEDDSLTLLLSHQYTEKSIRELGSSALKGVDSARIRVLEAANSALKENNLVFFIAQLSHEIDFYGEEVIGQCESTTWYSMSGKKLADIQEPIVTFNFLNPGQETLSRIWRPYGGSTYEGYLGNEEATRDTTYSRYAIIAWPLKNAFETALELISKSAAVEVLHHHRSLDAAALSKFMNRLSARTNTRYSFRSTMQYYAPEKNGGEDKNTPAWFYIGLCELVVGTGDILLVNRFLKEYLGHFDQDDDLLPSLISITRQCDWNDIEQEVLAALERCLDDVGTALRVANALATGPAHEALLRVGIVKALALGDKELCHCNCIDLLCKWTPKYGDTQYFESMVNRLKQVEPNLLQPATEEFVKYSGDLEDDKLAALSPIITKRTEWLRHKIDEMEKSFSWAMPDAYFPESTEIEEFLKGPEQSMITSSGERRFDDVQDACNMAAMWSRMEQDDASFEVEAGATDDNAFVTITKTRDWFDAEQGKLQECKLELQRLTEHWGKTSGQKHPREEEQQQKVSKKVAK